METELEMTRGLLSSQSSTFLTHLNIDSSHRMLLNTNNGALCPSASGSHDWEIARCEDLQRTNVFTAREQS